MFISVNFSGWMFYFIFVVLYYNEFVRGIIEGVLSSIVLWIFFAVLPLVSPIVILTTYIISCFYL